MTARADIIALVIEDIARTAERAQRPAAALLMRLRGHRSVAALEAVESDLRTASTAAARVAGEASGHLADGNADAAVKRLADLCGLSVEEWIAETRREHGAEVLP